MKAIVTTAVAGPANQDYIEISYTTGSDRFAVISRSTIDATELLLQSALDQVREMKGEIYGAMEQAQGPAPTTITVSSEAA